jgi:hypothetical protein
VLPLSIAWLITLAAKGLTPARSSSGGHITLTLDPGWGSSAREQLPAIDPRARGRLERVGKAAEGVFDQLELLIELALDALEPVDRFGRDLDVAREVGSEGKPAPGRADPTASRTREGLVRWSAAHGRDRRVPSDRADGSGNSVKFGSILSWGMRATPTPRASIR